MSELQAKKKEETAADTLFKYILVGNTSSGKTCLLHYYLEGKGNKSYYDYFKPNCSLAESKTLFS